MKVVIIGHGGHGKVVQDLLKAFPEHQFLGVLDDRYEYIENREGVLCGPISYADRLLQHFYDIRFINAIGNNQIRKRIVERMDVPEDLYLTLIHPTAFVSTTAVIGDGTVIMPHATVNAEATIQNHVIVNTGAIVEHDCRVESFAHLSPHATLTGAAIVEKGVHIGSNATLLPGVRVSEWAIIGAGATVISPIPPFSTAVGVPAKVIKNNNLKLKEA